MSEKGLSAHRTGEKNKRRVPEEVGRRRMVRQNIVPFHIDDMREEDLVDDHDVANIEEDQVIPVFQEKTKKSDEELVDDFLLSIFGKEALERDGFFHQELVEPIARLLVILKIQKEKAHPELSSEFLSLAKKAQLELKKLDEAEDFSKQKLFYFLEDYKKKLESINNMSTNETTQPAVEQTPTAEVAVETAVEKPAEVAAETVGKIDQQATTAVQQAPEAEPEIKKLATETKTEITEVLDEETGKMVKITKTFAPTSSNTNSSTIPSTILAPSGRLAREEMAIEDAIASKKNKLTSSTIPSTILAPSGRLAREEMAIEDAIASKKNKLTETKTEIEETGKMVKITKPGEERVLKNVRLDADANYDVMNEDFAMPNTEDSNKENILSDSKAEEQEEIEALRDLIKILETAYVAGDWSQRKSALQEAARILLNNKYAIIANEIRNINDDPKKNRAIEEAILEAEDEIRALEGGVYEKPKAPEKTEDKGSAEPKAPEKTEDKGSAEPKAPEKTEDKGSSKVEVVTDPELANKRTGFWEAVRKRGNVWSGGRFLGIFNQSKKTLDNFEEIKKNYDESLSQERDARMQEFVASLDASLSPEERNAKIFQKHMDLQKAEENQIDSIATNTEARTMVKFKSWWKKTALKRGILGIGLYALGAVTGGMGLLAAKAGLRGVGSYMMAESFLDTRTKMLGQKGLIDDLKNIGFKRKKKNGPDLITQNDKDAAIDLLMSDEYPLEVLEKEHARLRILSLDKSTKITEAGRFGSEQTLMVEAVLEAYRRKKAAQFIELTQSKGPEQAKATMLAGFLSQEKNATETATSEQDKSRSKAIKRHLVAGALGLTVGLLRPGPDTPEPETPPGAPIEMPIDDVISDKGDTVWGLVKERLAHEVPDWDQLNEAQQTRYIDYFENKVVANAMRYGLTDVDHLKPGTVIHWGDLFADKNLTTGMDWVKELTQEQMQNIPENNDVLKEAAKHGVEITSKNVNEVIAGIKDHGLAQYLADHGYGGVAKTIVTNAQEVASTHAETAANIVENAEATETATNVADASQAVETASDTETLADMGGSDKVYDFLHDKGDYNENILKMAKKLGELSNQHTDMVDKVVNKVFDVGSPTEIQHFLHDYDPTAFTEANNKAEVFLKMLQETGHNLSDINSLDYLKELTSSFDHLAHSPELPLGKAFEPRLIIGADGSEVYVFIKNAGKSVFGLFGDKQYILDGLSGHVKKVTEVVAKTLLSRNNIV